MTKPKVESVAKALIINSLNKALILTIGEYKSRPERSYTPDLPGGLVDGGESERDAVLREIYEETGIKLTPDDIELRYAETKFYSDEDKSVSKFLYTAHLDYIPSVTLSWEHSAYEWVALDELLQTKELRPFFNQAIKYCISNNLV